MLGGGGVLPLSSQLLTACRFGMTGILREMIEQRTEPMPQEALFVAACYNQQDIVRAPLQRKDIDINEVTCLRTPLYLASRQGHQGVVEELLRKRDLRVNDLDQVFQEPALMVAIRRGHEGVVRCLLQRKDVDVNYISSPNTILGEAAALAIAIALGHSSIFRLLLKRNDIDVNLTVQDQTPLKLAVRKYRPTYVEMLLERDDILVNPIDKDGKAPLDYAGQIPEIARVIRQKDGKLGVEMEAIPLPDKAHREISSRECVPSSTSSSPSLSPFSTTCVTPVIASSLLLPLTPGPESDINSVRDGALHSTAQPIAASSPEKGICHASLIQAPAGTPSSEIPTLPEPGAPGYHNLNDRIPADKPVALGPTHSNESKVLKYSRAFTKNLMAFRTRTLQYFSG